MGFTQGLAIAATALLLLALQQTTPGYPEITGPISLRGHAGQPISARSFVLTVDKLITAETLRWRGFGRENERDTGGIWLVVKVRLEARSDTTTVSGAFWRGPSGRRFEASRRVAGAPLSILGERLEPGLPREGPIIFEVPANEARGGVLLLSAIRSPRLDTQVEVSIPNDRFESAGRIDLTRVLP